MSREPIQSAARPPVPPAAEEVRLARRIEQGDLDAKREMIERNLGLVYAVAKHYRGSGVPFEDLVQEGTLGLVRAVEKFDHRRGLKLSTYAVWWIRRAVADAISDGRIIRIPADAAVGLAAIRRAEQDLARTVPGPVSPEAVAERTGLSVRRVRALLEAARVTASLDQRVSEDGAPLGELIPDREAVDPWRHTDARETHRQLWAMLGTLPARHRDVLLRRYGLRGDSPETHMEIGARLGLGDDRSRQLEREALHRLRSIGGERRLAA
jgi:RNA polymerase primary sigma factor